VTGAAIQELLHQAVRVDGGGPAHPSGAAVEADATADQVHLHRAEEAVDGIGATVDLRAGASGQQAKAQLAQQRQAPFFIGEAGARLACGEVCGSHTKLRPELAETVPRLGDDLAQALAVQQAVVLGSAAIELFFGVEDAAQQVGRQQAALGADGLEGGSALGHG
jgi:hypothetical protein